MSRRDELTDNIEEAAQSLVDAKAIYQTRRPNIPARQKSITLSAVEWLRLSPNALTIDVDLTEDEWLLLIESVEGIHRKYQWYLGDCIVYGVKREYGMTGSQMARLSEITGKDENTLAEYYRTARLFEIVERSTILEFEQHRVIARAFSEDTPEHRHERLRWLKIAEDGKLSGRKLSAAIQQSQLPAAAGDNPTPPETAHPALSDDIEEEAVMFSDVTVKEVKKRAGYFFRCIAENRLQDVPRDDFYLLVQYVNRQWSEYKRLAK